MIRLTARTDDRVSVNDERLLFTVIRAAFSQRRKTLMNALRNSSELNLGKEETISALQAAGLPENIRGEALTLEEFARLSDEIGRL